MCKLGMITQKRLKIEVMLLLSADRKSYMPRRLAQHWITLSDFDWPFHASRAVSAIAELPVLVIIAVIMLIMTVIIMMIY